MENEMKTNIQEYIEWESLLEEAEKEVKEIREKITNYMIEEQIEEFVCDNHIVRFSEISSQRLDSTSLKRDYKDLYNSYLKSITSRRFSIA